MKIAFLFKALDFGGAQKMMSFVINSVAALSDEVVIILQDKADIAYEMPENKKIIVLEEDYKLRCPLVEKVFRIFSQSKKVERILCNEGIDVLCTFGVYYSLIAVLATRKVKTKILASERRSPANLNVFWKNLSKWVYRKCDRIVFQLEGARKFYRNIEESNARIIPNP